MWKPKSKTNFAMFKGVQLYQMAGGGMGTQADSLGAPTDRGTLHGLRCTLSCPWCRGGSAHVVTAWGRHGGMETSVPAETLLSA